MVKCVVVFIFNLVFSVFLLCFLGRYRESGEKESEKKHMGAEYLTFRCRPIGGLRAVWVEKDRGGSHTQGGAGSDCT